MFITSSLPLLGGLILPSLILPKRRHAMIGAASAYMSRHLPVGVASIASMHAARCNSSSRRRGPASAVEATTPV